MSRHRYPARALAGDYLRAGAGLAVTGGPLLLLETATGVAAVLAALAGVFALFAARTGLRHVTVVELSGAGIALHGPARGRLPWDRIEQVRLDYFATRRDAPNGWMQLRLGGAGRRIRIDSTIEGFEALAESAAAAAARRGVVLTETTEDNLRALGIDPPDAAREAGA